MEITFKNEHVFITGGSRGIGKAIADSFRGAQADVLAPGRDALDLSDSANISGYLSALPDMLPGIVILNAGMNVSDEIGNISQETLMDIFQVNVFSSVQLLRHFVPAMKKAGRGKIVFISSLYSFVSKEGRAAYSGSKNAITGLVKTLALELAPFNICVNAVAPGYVMTGMTKKNLSAAEIKEIARMIPTGRLQAEAEIADAVLFLCSDYNKSITGHVLPVDGGFLCR